jgi:Txe/YoeB family toxin of Txe-Axe toxin-antitoxin module
METFRLEFNPKIKAKILELLSSFSADELKIIREDEFLDKHFEENKSRLDVSLSKIKNGTAKLYTIEEVSTYLDKTISEYDN